jgi:hypothetical protein
VKWVHDKAFQKGPGDSSKTSDNLSGIPSLVIFFLDLIQSLACVILTKEELDKRIFFKKHNKYFRVMKDAFLRKAPTQY